MITDRAICSHFSKGLSPERKVLGPAKPESKRLPTFPQGTLEVLQQ